MPAIGVMAQARFTANSARFPYRDVRNMRVLTCQRPLSQNLQTSLGAWSGKVVTGFPVRSCDHWES